MELDLYTTPLAVCRLPADDAVPAWAVRASPPLVSITRTDSELSLVLPQADLPSGVPAELGWHALAVRGPLPFHLVGALASLTAPLADAGVPIFAISTHDTDWVLVKDERMSEACIALEAAGHRVHDAAAPAGEV